MCYNTIIIYFIFYYEKTDILDFLFQNSFNILTYEEKCQLKSNRPTPNIALEYKEGSLEIH